MNNPDHILFKDGDPNIPSAILDRNGSVALGLCRLCGKGEVELEKPCRANPAPWNDDTAIAVVAGDTTLLCNGRPFKVAVRVLSEPNYKLAVIAVNAYAEAQKNAESWRCFCCDEVFTERAAALEHFGDEYDMPACRLNAQEGGLLGLLRTALRELRAYHDEDDAQTRMFYKLGADHSVEKRELGDKEYARGLADGRAGISTFIDINDWDADMLQAFQDAAVVHTQAHVDIFVGRGLLAAHKLYVEKRGG